MVVSFLGLSRIILGKLGNCFSYKIIIDCKLFWVSNENHDATCTTISAFLSSLSSYCTMYFSGTLGISLRSTSILRACCLCRASAAPTRPSRRRCWPYTTVKSGTRSPGRIRVRGASVQYYYTVSMKTKQSSRGVWLTLPITAPLPIWLRAPTTLPCPTTAPASSTDPVSTDT